jgi:hypothetical protein
LFAACCLLPAVLLPAVCGLPAAACCLMFAFLVLLEAQAVVESGGIINVVIDSVSRVLSFRSHSLPCYSADWLIPDCVGCESPQETCVSTTFWLLVCLLPLCGTVSIVQLMRLLPGMLRRRAINLYESSPFHKVV